MLEKLKSSATSVALVGASAMFLVGCTGPSYGNIVVDQSSTSVVASTFGEFGDEPIIEYSVKSATFDFFPEDAGNVADPRDEESEYVKIDAVVTNVSSEPVDIESYDFRLYAGIEELYPTIELSDQPDTLENSKGVDSFESYALQPGESVSASYYYMPLAREGLFGAESFIFATAYEGVEGVELVLP